MDTGRIEIEDENLTAALSRVDDEQSRKRSYDEAFELDALRKLADAVRAHLSGPASCTAVRAAEAERYDITTSETARLLAGIESDIRRGREELARLNAVCDSRTARQ